MEALNNSSFSTTLKSRIDYFLMLIDIFIICIFALKLKDIGIVIFHFSISSPYNFNSPLIILALYVIGFCCIYNLLFMFTGKSTFIISNNKLTIIEKIVGISSTKNYQIDLIKNPKIENVGSRTAWGFQGFSFSDYTMDVLVFTYNNSEIMLGRALENFNAQELKDAVR